jgi:hypothetical protein
MGNCGLHSRTHCAQCTPPAPAGVAFTPKKGPVCFSSLPHPPSQPQGHLHQPKPSAQAQSIFGGIPVANPNRFALVFAVHSFSVPDLRFRLFCDRESILIQPANPTDQRQLFPFNEILSKQRQWRRRAVPKGSSKPHPSALSTLSTFRPRQ